MDTWSNPKEVGVEEKEEMSKVPYYSAVVALCT